MNTEKLMSSSAVGGSVEALIENADEIQTIPPSMPSTESAMNSFQIFPVCSMVCVFVFMFFRIGKTARSPRPVES